MNKKSIDCDNLKNKKIQKKKAFTLIELLAVIIILGVLMIIAIPSVTKYINDSRKNGYVSTAKEIAGGARNLIHSGSLNLNDKDTTYYIDSECIDTSNSNESPYGAFTKAYVVVNYNDDGYDYYWLSVDDTGNGVKTITSLENLDIDSIESNLTSNDILDTLGVDARHNYVIINKESGCTIGDSTVATSRVTDDGQADVVDYPIGKSKKTLSHGDIIKIGNEEFYYLRNDGNNMILFAHYNLKVGNLVRGSDGRILKTYTSSDSGYGIQSSECRGVNGNDYNEDRNCVVAFSSTNYWDGQLGEGKKYQDYEVYDENSILYSYIQNYKTYLESFGVNVKEARVYKYGDYGTDDSFYVPITCATSYWEGKVSSYGGSYKLINMTIYPNMEGISTYIIDDKYGIRPIIVI